MSTNLAPFIKFREVDANGNPLAGGMLYSYQAGTTTPQATYTDSSGVTPNSNPVILDASGRASVWLDVALSYKFVLKDSSDAEIWTEDNVIGLTTNDSVSTAAIQDGAVTTVKLANDAVTSSKLQDDPTIDANRAVTTDHIRNGAITSIKVGDSGLPVNGILNMGYAASVAANALTIARKQLDGSTNHTAALPGVVVFRDSSLTNGNKTVIKSTAAASITVPSGTTLGTVSGVVESMQIFEVNNAGTMEIGVGVGCFIDDGVLHDTLAVSGGTTRGRIHTTTARTGVAVRLIGQIKISEVTAGTWTSSPSVVSIAPFSIGSRSIVRLNTSNGRGSTNTKIRRFLNVDSNYGAAITYADSASLGASFTINQDGIYTVNFYIGVNTGTSIYQNGISLNSNQLTTDVATITASARLNMAGLNAAGSFGSTSVGNSSWTGPLYAGDIIRAHGDGTDPTDASLCGFSICQVSG